MRNYTKPDLWLRGADLCILIHRDDCPSPTQRARTRERAKTSFISGHSYSGRLLCWDMDRRLGGVGDRASFVVVVHDEDCKHTVRQVRE